MYRLLHTHDFVDGAKLNGVLLANTFRGIQPLDDKLSSVGLYAEVSACCCKPLVTYENLGVEPLVVAKTHRSVQVPIFAHSSRWVWD